MNLSRLALSGLEELPIILLPPFARKTTCPISFTFLVTVIELLANLAIRSFAMTVISIVSSAPSLFATPTPNLFDSSGAMSLARRLATAYDPDGAQQGVWPSSPDGDALHRVALAAARGFELEPLAPSPHAPPQHRCGDLQDGRLYEPCGLAVLYPVRLQAGVSLVQPLVVDVPLGERLS